MEFEHFSWRDTQKANSHPPLFLESFWFFRTFRYSRVEIRFYRPLVFHATSQNRLFTRSDLRRPYLRHVFFPRDVFALFSLHAFRNVRALFRRRRWRVIKIPRPGFDWLLGGKALFLGRWCCIVTETHRLSLQCREWGFRNSVAVRNRVL